MTKTFYTFFSFFSLALLTTAIGCGQKGPLYLPQNTIDLDKPTTTIEKDSNKKTKEQAKRPETAVEKPAQTRQE